MTNIKVLFYKLSKSGASDGSGNKAWWELELLVRVLIDARVLIDVRVLIDARLPVEEVTMRAVYQGPGVAQQDKS